MNDEKDREDLVEFTMSPDRDSYLALREKVIASEAYQPYSNELETAGEFYEQGQVEEARDVLQNAMPNLLLSPRAHHLLSILFSKLGDEKSAQFEFFFGDACLEGILATGDGSADKPYLVVRTSDEYDVLEHLGKQLSMQGLTADEEKHLDVIKCQDGTQYVFDITEAYNQLTKSFDEE